MLNSLGQEIDAFCGKCQVVLLHTVTKLSGPRITRVACETCKDEHAYRKSPPKSAGVSPDAQKAVTARRQSLKAAAAFAAVMELADVAAAQPYKPSTRFSADDLIDHAAFGVGRVMRVLAGNKIEVIFKSSAKILVHAGGAAAL